MNCKSFFIIGFFFVFLFLGQGCVGIRSRYHSVVEGDSPASIAEKYGISIDALKTANQEACAQKKLLVGTKLYIPFESDSNWNKNELRNITAEGQPPSSPLTERSLSQVASQFHWPVAGPVSSLFGRRKKTRTQSGFHEGIDIVASRGTPVKAARSGHIIYAGNRIRGYGNMVIIRHLDDYSTVYAHLSKLNVKKGQFVARGQKIGGVGRTGHASGIHLHFEVRQKQTPIDPMLLLQGQNMTNVATR